MWYLQISGCLTAAGEVCSAESDNESRFGTLTSDGDCIWTIHIEGSKTISESYSIDTYLNGIPYFTSVEASLALTSTAEGTLGCLMLVPEVSPN
jgi:hypothetical protein